MWTMLNTTMISIILDMKCPHFIRGSSVGMTGMLSQRGSKQEYWTLSWAACFCWGLCWVDLRSFQPWWQWLLGWVLRAMWDRFGVMFIHFNDCQAERAFFMDILTQKIGITFHLRPWKQINISLENWWFEDENSFKHSPF